MAVSRIESAWQFMFERTLEIEYDSTNIDLTCGICHKLMVDACTTVCGCQYCYKCISEYLADGEKYCPGKTEDCKEESLNLRTHVLKNSLLNKKILATKVRCPNQSCACYIVWTQMEDHLRVCTTKQTECPFVQIGCNKDRASKDVIVTHLQNETFTHSQLLIELIHNLKNEVDGLKDKFGISQLEISSMRKELTLKDVQIEEIKLQMDEQKRELECLKKDARNKTGVITTLEDELGKLRNEMALRLTTMIEETEKGEKEMGEQRRSIENVMNELREGREKCDKDRERRMHNWIKWNKLLPNIDVDFVWRIDEISKKMAKMKGQSIFSELFYSNNYKLCLRIIIGKNGDDTNLDCHIMRGDNDDKVQWPMILSVTVSIINQDTLRTHTSHTVSRDTYTCGDHGEFDRCTTHMNNWGIDVAYPFIKYSSIKHDKSLVVDDSIIISCVIGDST